MHINRIDWPLLYRQKQHLQEMIEVAKSNPAMQEHVESLHGILHMIDYIQDVAVVSGEASEIEVFTAGEET